jgi:putative transposase
MMRHISKSLYNQTSYILRRQFIKKGKLSSYIDLVKLFQMPSDSEDNDNYRKLPAQTARWTVKKVEQACNSFFKALKTWRKHPERFMGKPGMPGYKNRTVNSC